MKLLSITVLIASIWTTTLFAQTVNIGFEPFPPMITEHGKGHVINMLHIIENNSDLKFNIEIMTYARAKLALKDNKIDLIGLTPQYLETKEFYTYAQDLSWSIAAQVDIFSLESGPIDIAKIPDTSIGTLIGNADFFSELLDIPREKFVEVSNLTQLVKMLDQGRLELATFERIAMMSTIKRLKIKTIFYQKYGVIQASMAVANNAKGLTLKNKLDKLLKKSNVNFDHQQIIDYRNLPDSGVVSIAPNFNSLELKKQR